MISTTKDATPEFRALFNQAVGLKNQERHDEAARLFERLREMNPRSAPVHGMLGAIFWEQGKLPEATDSFRKATEISPKSETASLGLFHTLLEMGDKRSAFAEMNRFVGLGCESQDYKAIAYSLAKESAPLEESPTANRPST